MEDQINVESTYEQKSLFGRFYSWLMAIPILHQRELIFMKHQGFIRELVLRRAQVPSFDAYPYSIPAVRELDRLRLHPAVTFLVGENGSGKSTFIEAMAILAGFNPEGGSKHFNTRQRPSESNLHQHLQLIRNPRREKTGFFLRAETMFNVATEIEQGGYNVYGWESLHLRSHGEAFLWLMQNRFGSHGLYLLDEPESALSPQRQFATLRLIHDLVAQGSQFIIATHSPILLAYPKATIYWLDETGLRETTYTETEHYQLTRNFLNNHEAMLHYLFV